MTLNAATQTITMTVEELGEMMKAVARETLAEHAATQVLASPPDPDDDSCDLKKAAKLAGCSVRTMRRHIKAGRVYAWRVGVDPTSMAAPLRVARADALALRVTGALTSDPASVSSDDSARSTVVRQTQQRRVSGRRQPAKSTRSTRTRTSRANVTPIDARRPRAESREEVRARADAVRARLGRAA